MLVEAHRVCLLHAYLVNVDAYVENADTHVVNADITQYASNSASHKSSIRHAPSLRHASRPVYARPERHYRLKKKKQGHGGC